MTKDETQAILEKERDEAIKAILVLAEKAEKYYQLKGGPPEPSQPYGNIPPYKKGNHRGRKKKPGQKAGHLGLARKKPLAITDHKKHTLSHCPQCGTGLKRPVRRYKRIIEDLPLSEPQITEHTINGYWCAHCQKIVEPTVVEALPNSNLGLRMVVYAAWLHYMVGISVKNLVRVLSIFDNFQVSPGGLTQAWGHLADLLKADYEALGEKIARSAVLHADETGWRLSGVTYWLWCFATQQLCYYLITPDRGSPIVKQVLGTLFKGILITDFWGAYNQVVALAKQKCLYHLFTELVNVDQRNNSLAWHLFRKQLSRLLKDALRLAEKRLTLTTEDFQRIKVRLYARLDRLGAAVMVDDHDVQRIRKRLVRHRDEFFTFLDLPEVSPYNNHAERQIRPLVISRKISQQNRSQHGGQAQAVLMSLFQTAKLQGLNPLDQIAEQAQKAILSRDLHPEILKNAA